MGLCLYVFDHTDDEDEPEELAWCDVGHYSDFGCFRDTIARNVPVGSCPTLMTHSDSDGEWTLEQVALLERELKMVAEVFQSVPAEELQGGFKHAAEYRVGARTLYECFHDVDGENLFEALLELCRVARENNRPITFM